MEDRKNAKKKSKKRDVIEMLLGWALEGAGLYDKCLKFSKSIFLGNILEFPEMNLSKFRNVSNKYRLRISGALLMSEKACFENNFDRPY